MRYLLYSILAGALMGLPGQQTTPEAPPPVEEEQPPPPSPESTETPASQEDELSPFTPSEKVPADSAISFPVDI